ncbi:hypothetical protein FXF51_09455 [Nonomuraea sp. PA05]|uniref:hypothetical protein n=1 Tax=Nonomuraea sp. PA05 TaxID=2604466 RepID=UPI0011DB8CF9|nr:hypothetical protein [Nonomuraea sp. PA05]TYB68746.1 hypothetical protein FXF51_09455 [Nonomuraea sp. PA05]
MRAATHLLAGAALAITPMTPATATAQPQPRSHSQSPTCHYVNQTADPAPIRIGPGKKHRRTAVLPPTETPVKSTCAARGRGADHWVRIKTGDHKGDWIWRNRLQPWSGQ